MSGKDDTTGSHSLRRAEEALIRRIVQGEREMFRELVARYQQQVFGMIMRQVGNQATAEDLTQETFVRAYRALRSFKGDAAFSTWLTRIALNQTSSYFTSKRHRQERRSDELDPGRHGGEDRSLENRIEQAELQRAFGSALAELKPEFRDTLTLCALEGRSYEEAAAILEVPVGTVRSRLNKARLLLREALHEYLPERE